VIPAVAKLRAELDAWSVHNFRPDSEIASTVILTNKLGRPWQQPVQAARRGAGRTRDLGRREVVREDNVCR
jgi:hypothetical protein